MIKTIYFLLLLCTSLIFAQHTDIIVLRENNSLGNPIGLDQVFTVSGIVTSSTEFGNNGPSSLQDNTAGISVYGSGFAGAVSVGDSVTIISPGLATALRHNWIASMQPFVIIISS